MVTPAQSKAPAQFTTALPEDEIPNIVGGCTLAGLRTPPGLHAIYHTTAIETHMGSSQNKVPCWVLFIRMPYYIADPIRDPDLESYPYQTQYRNPHNPSPNS